MDKSMELKLWKAYIVAAFSLLLFGLYFFIKWYLEFNMRTRKIFKMLQHYKTPSYIPILGHAIKFMGTPTRIHNNIVRCCFKYGPNFVIWLFDNIIMMIGKPEDVSKVLQSQTCLEKNELYRFTQDIVGLGLFTAPVDLWRKNRRIINQTFNARILEGYQPVFGKTATTFVDEILPQHVDKKDPDWYTLFTAVNLDVIMQTAMGVDKDVQRKNLPFGHWLDDGMRAIFIRMLQMFYYPDFIFFRTKLGKMVKNSQEKIWKFTDEVITERRMKFKKELENDKYRPSLGEDSGKSTEKKAFLDYLLELDHKGQTFTDKNLRDEVNTFFVGGTDTTSVTACFFLTLMGMNQDIQQKVYEEVMQVLGPDRLPSVQDLNDMQLLDRCIKETMRIFTPAPIILRHNTGDLQISDGIIPAGVSIGICIFYIHRSELYWEEPLKFNPDRFLPDQVMKRHPYTFIPFSGGLRGCIGQRFASVNLKTLVSLIIRKYKIYCDAYKSVEEIKLKNVMVLRPIDGFKFRMERRRLST